jgi:hypothetical protein
MTEVVRSHCPGCRRNLTIPADWTGQTVRCKHCGHSMQVLRKAPVAVAAPAAVPMAMPVAAPMPTWEPLPNGTHPPEYTPPVAPLPAMPVPPSAYVSAFDAQDRFGGGAYRGPKNRAILKYVVFGVLFMALAGGAAAIAYMKPGLLKPGSSDSSQADNGSTPQPGSGGQSGPVEHAASGVFPRRMLAISIHSYLYANPLHNGDTGFAMDDARRSGTDAAVRRLAERWRVPREQLYHLTDARLATEKEARPEGKKGETPAEPARRADGKALPLKMVVEGAVTRFVESSRAQDRIVILFCGHAVEIKGETYLVPLEGDLEEVESLIPLKWFYDKLAACPAQEKVVIYDVCRFHPERGVERPHPGPMSEAMETALHDSPEGVSVITSCSKGEQALELDYFNTQLSFDTPGVKGSGINLYGSFFLSMIHAASIGGALAPEKKIPAPADEIPIERFATWMKDKLGEVVLNRFGRERPQTVKATIKRRSESVAFNPAETVPARFDFPNPPPSADPKSVMAIVREIQLPPVKSFRADAPPPSVSDILPFSEEAMKAYLAGELKPGDTPNEFQRVILDAVEEMRKLRGSESGTELPEEFGGDTSDRAKEQLRKVQEIPARVEAILKEHLDNLEAIAEQKEKQPRRWQVHYDYVLAQVKLRICYVNQYNLALALVRGGKLPDLADGQNGYRLTAETKLHKDTGGDYKEMFNDARKTLTDIYKQHPNTPWALLAKSDRTVAIGLRLTGSSVSGGVR